MRIAGTLLFFVFVIPFFAPSTSFARLQGTNISAAFPQDLKNSLSEYGYFEAGENDFGLTPLLTRLVQKLQQPGDPTYSVILSKTPDANAFIYQTVSTEAYVVVNIGLIQKVDTLDELVILLAHELSHSSAFGRSARLVRGQLEEIETADRGSMERTLKAGYDPRAILSLFSTLTSGNSTRSGFFNGFLGSHPNMESRRTAANAWLRENFNKRPFPRSSPVSWPYLVNQYKATPTAKIKKEREKRPEAEAFHELERLSKIANQSPAYQTLTPYLKMALFLGSLGSYEFDYYGLLQRAIDQNLQLDQSALSHILSGNDSQLLTFPNFDFPKGHSSRFAVFLMNLSRELESVTISKEQGDLLNSLYSQNYVMHLGRHLPLVDENGEPLSEYAFRLQIETAILSAAFPETRLPFIDPKAIRDVSFANSDRFRFFKMSKIISLIERSSDPRIIADSFIYADFSFEIDFIEENKGKLKSAFRWAVEHDNYDGAALLKLMGCDKYNSNRYTEILAEAFNGETISPARKIILYVQLERSLPDIKDRILTGLRKSFGSPAELFSPKITALKVYQGIEQVLAGNGASWKLDWGLATQIVQDTNAWQRSREIEIVDVLYKQYASRYSGPAYDYGQKYAELLQKWMASALVRSRELPERMVGNRESLQEWIRFWELITSRAVTSYTDQLALQIFSSENIKKYPDLKSKMRPALEEKRVWDFALRKELLLITRRTVWNDIESTNDKYERTKKIQEEIGFINQVFPESSFERQVALEKFTNHIRANASEASVVENAKSNRDSNADGVGMRVFSGFYEHVFSEVVANRSKDRHENTFATLQFLLGNAPIPKFLGSALEAVGPDRFQRMFSTLDPEIRALVLAPLLERPRGLLNDSQWEDKVIELILSGVTAHQAESRLFLRALIHSLEKEAPFERTLVISFMLSMRVNSSGKEMPIGLLVRQCLEAQGNSGVSLGQKIRQRELAPREILEHLDDLQDRTRVPSRFAIFEMIKRRIPNAEAMLERGELKFLDIVGAASSKVVITVQYKNGTTETIEDEILKLLRDDFDRTTEVEIAKLRSMLSYLETHGSERYRRFRSVLDLIERNLRNQNDLRAESRLFEKTKQLYANASVGSKFKFVVVTPHSGRGAARDFSHEELARGSSLKSLSPEQQAKVYAAIYEVEGKILLSDLKGNDEVFFEADRHRGNYIVNLETNTIFVIDYNLLSSITSRERLAVIETLGFLYMHLSYKTSLQGVMPRWIFGLVGSRLGEGIRNRINAKEEAFSRFGLLFDGITTEKWSGFWKKAQPILDRRESIDQAGIFGAFQELLAVAEESGLQLRPQVNDYIFGLGHLEFYSKFAQIVYGQNPLSLTIRDHMAGKIKSALLSGKGGTRTAEIKTAVSLMVLPTKRKVSCQALLTSPPRPIQ